MPDPADLAPLSPADCPLLGDAPDILDRFRRLAGVFAKLADDPRVLDRPDVQRARHDLLRLRARLRRPRYQVGFLGTTQVAKSSTILSLLDRKKGEGPVDPGEGPPKTSAVTRIVPQDAGDHALRIRYLTPDQYAEKRAKLCASTGLDPASPDDTLLDELAKLLAGTPAAAPGAADTPPMVRDVETLGRLIKSRAQYKQLVADPAVTQAHPYAQREAFVNHPPEVPGQRFAANPNHLIREVEIGLTSDRLPRRLEMIDLPGLGSDGSSDDILTKGFLHELDGALVFLRSDQHGDPNVEYIMSKLRQEFEGGVGRIWVVVTKMDVPEQHALYAEGGTAEGLLKFLDRHGLAGEQLVLTCKRLHERRGPDGTVTLAQAAAIVQIKPDDPVPPRFRADPVLEAAFRDLLTDGGTGRLRAIVTQNLEKRVAADTQRVSREQLGRVAGRLAQAVELHKQVAGGNIKLLVLAQQCRTAITREVTALDTQMDWFAAPAAEVRKELDAILDTIFPAEPDNLRQGPGDLARLYTAHAEILNNTLATVFQTHVVEPAYGKVAGRLAGPEFATVPVGDTLGPAAYWEAVAAADAGPQAGWRRAGFPGFKADLAALFAPPPDGEEEVRVMSGGHYRDMLQEKIRAVVGQGVHRVRAQLRARLDELRDQLGQLPAPDAPAPEWGGPSALDLDALLAELRDLCRSV
ncbi:MAG: hypothetical protein K2P78_12115 [Gemmataceae bacterium]|nr:hypothetical protein [Gemmataceae bacterium]